jgi:D-alanyl-lipoteichoic acid acyltransferase DltB (MBOAT superfamily)
MSTVTRSAAELDDSRPAFQGTTGIGSRELSPHQFAGTNLRRYLLILGQLGVLIALVYRFQLESESFRRLMLLAAVGFAIHYFLPLRQRLGFFVLLSLAGIGLVLGPIEGAWLVGIGLALIGVCHLPIPLFARASILCVAAVGVAVLRIGIGQVPWSSALWPILGSMFVFRLIIYFYDRSHETTPPRLSQTLGYFFLLPNVCFPLFPVVDFKKFCHNYYDAERHGIYQVGIEWIWRGLVQLILYRLIYYHLTLDPVAVTNLGDLVVYMLSTFLLYVRISGQFHLIVGMLHLFGFNLPETHHRYFLASSFTDFWRRINIYWKDFMMKVFYYPAFFRLRRLGDTKALVLATAFTFLMTWFLHFLQWFWIRGSLLIELNDVIFWTVLALLVLINSLYETRHRRARILTRARTFRESAGLVFRTIGTFCVICVLWSFWTAESASDWMLMMEAAGTLPPWSPIQIGLLSAVLLAAVALAVYVVCKGWGAADQRPAVRMAPATVIATTVGLCVLTVPSVAQRVGQRNIVESLRSASLNRRDAEEFQRGYYENLLDVSRFNRELQQIYAKMPKDFVRSLSVLGLSRRTGDEQEYELVPNKEGRFAGAMVRTNHWGMRDREYSLERPDGVYRIALLGPSTAMGSGVEAHESFEALLEERLNQDLAPDSSTSFEILNFGVAGYSPLHMLYQLERKVFAFKPDMALFLGHVSDLEGTSRRWARMARSGLLPRDPFHDDLLRRSGLTPQAGPNEARRRLKPFERELLGWVYRRFVTQCRQRGITPVFVYLQKVTEPGEGWSAPVRDQILALAAEAGFPVLDLSGVFHYRGRENLWIAENDAHPNALGSRLVADKLYTLLLERRAELRLGQPQ